MCLLLALKFTCDRRTRRGLTCCVVAVVLIRCSVLKKLEDCARSELHTVPSAHVHNGECVLCVQVPIA